MLVYVTFKNQEEADKICDVLLNKKLIACANIFPINSKYIWKGKMINDSEYLGFLKTNKKNYKKVESEIKKIHSYKIPCILRINSKANVEYDNWCKEVLR